MKYKVYNYRTKKAEWFEDTEDCGSPSGLPFLEYVRKYGHVVEDKKEIQEVEKAFSKLEETEYDSTKREDI